MERNLPNKSDYRKVKIQIVRRFDYVCMCIRQDKWNYILNEGVENKSNERLAKQSTTGAATTPPPATNCIQLLLIPIKYTNNVHQSKPYRIV